MTFSHTTPGICIMGAIERRGYLLAVTFSALAVICLSTILAGPNIPLLPSTFCFLEVGVYLCTPRRWPLTWQKIDTREYAVGSVNVPHLS